MTSFQAYLTQPKEKDFRSKLMSYVNNIENKIERAKWKQNLILTYNYMPLQITKDNIQVEKQQYLKKLQILQTKFAQQTRNQQIQNQVQQNRDFSVKLLSKMKQIQQRIELLRMEIKVRMAAVEDKRFNLKNIIRQNAQLTKHLISYQVNKRSISQAIKSKQSSRTQQKVKKESLKQIKGSRTTERTERMMKQSMYTAPSVTGFYSSRDRYQQCVNQMVKSLKKMNASQDVQAGIYLEIMNRKFSNKAATFSLKSKTCDVLMDRYKDLRRQRPKQNEDFSMSLQTFLGLNWKQIMGIILVKDRNANKLRQLLNISQTIKI